MHRQTFSFFYPFVLSILTKEIIPLSILILYISKNFRLVYLISKISLIIFICFSAHQKRKKKKKTGSNPAHNACILNSDYCYRIMVVIVINLIKIKPIIISTIDIYLANILSKFQLKRKRMVISKTTPNKVDFEIKMVQRENGKFKF